MGALGKTSNEKRGGAREHVIRSEEGLTYQWVEDQIVVTIGHLLVV